MMVMVIVELMGTPITYSHSPEKDLAPVIAARMTIVYAYNHLWT